MKGEPRNMNRQPGQPHGNVRKPAYRQAVQRLDEALEQRDDLFDDEKTEALGRRIFGDLWAGPEDSGGVKLSNAEPRRSRASRLRAPVMRVPPCPAVVKIIRP